MTRRALAVAMAMAAIMTVTARGRAAVVFFETFETYTAVAGTGGDNGDNDPVNPGDGNPNNWVAVSAESPATAAQVALGSTTDGLGANQQYLDISTSTEPPDNVFFGRSFAAATGSGASSPAVQFKVRPDVIAVGDDSSATNAGTRFLLNGANSSNSSITGVTIVVNQIDAGTDRGLVLNHGTILGGSTSAVTPLIPDLVAGHWYEVVLTFDFSTPIATFSATATDLDNPATTVTLAGLYVRFDILNIHTLRFAKSSGSSPAEFQNLGVDDIVITIPEPATLALLALVTPIALVRRR